VADGKDNATRAGGGNVVILAAEDRTRAGGGDVVQALDSRQRNESWWRCCLCVGGGWMRAGGGDVGMWAAGDATRAGGSNVIMRGADDKTREGC
jgi:hypothetical protein